jgi:membrane protein DedA with SNARE-associated domain
MPVGICGMTLPRFLLYSAAGPTVWSALSATQKALLPTMLEIAKLYRPFREALVVVLTSGNAVASNPAR